MIEIPLETTETPGPPCLPTSVVVVSRGRPEHLRRAVLSLIQQDHPALELVVVADEPGLANLAALPGRDRIKSEPFDDANISAARNIGIALAAGEVVAFMDDDAVAEPTWARRLAAGFCDPKVNSATGFTRGRNGLSWQWCAAALDRTGLDRPLTVPEIGTTLHAPPKNGAIKTHGTNAAFRRSALVAAGGFDSRYRYFLDEADLNLRMARDNTLTAIVPDAQVLHGYAGNATRRDDRTPKDLFEIAASAAVFAKTHAPDDSPAVIARFRDEQRRRVSAYLVSGSLEPREFLRLMASFERGVEDGRTRPKQVAEFATPPPFLPLHIGDLSPKHVVVACRPWRRDHAHATALQHLARGTSATVLTLGPTPKRHKVFFNESGIWEQLGGTLGPAIRSESWLRLVSFRRRVAAEARRIAQTRTPLPASRRSVNPEARDT